MPDHRNQAGELAEALSRSAEAVCRHYLSAGRRSGHHWLVGDVDNTPGRSLYVRLVGPTTGKGAAGRWCDAATAQYGDLLDLIRLNRGYGSLRDAMDEARSFLALPRPAPKPYHPADRGPARLRHRRYGATPVRLRAADPGHPGSSATSWPAASTSPASTSGALRFHPAAHYREAPDSPRQTFPALLAAVTDPAGTVTGVHRTYLDPRPDASLDRARLGKAPVASPRRSLGQHHWQRRPPAIPRRLGAARRRRARDGAVAHAAVPRRRSARGAVGRAPRHAGPAIGHLPRC